MLGIFPWKLLRAGAPVNKPGRPWFDAVTRVLSTIGIRYGDLETAPHIERPGINGAGWNIVLPPPEVAAAGAGVIRFKVQGLSETSIKVLVGTQTRNGGPVTSSETTLSSLTAGPYYITGTLADAADPTGLDPALRPQRLLVTAETSEPSADTFDTAFLIAVVTCTDSVITSISQRHLGDRDNTVMKPDSEMAAPKQSETIVIDATTGETRLRGAESAGNTEKFAYLDADNKLTWTDSGPAADDVKCAVDAAATAGYLGANYNDGILRVDNDTITKADGGDFVTLAGKKSVENVGDGDYTFGLLPPGGSQYQVLQKSSGTDYRVKWDWTRAHA